MPNYPVFRNDRVKSPGRHEATYPNRKAVKAAETFDGMKGVAWDVGAGRPGKHFASPTQFPEHHRP